MVSFPIFDCRFWILDWRRRTRRLGSLLRGDGMADGTRSVPATGKEDVGAAAGGEGRADRGVDFRLMAADETLEVVAERDGIKEAARGACLLAPGTETGCGRLLRGMGGRGTARGACLLRRNEDCGAAAGGDGRADRGVDFRLMAAGRDALQVVAEGDGRANGTRSVPAYGERRLRGGC